MINWNIREPKGAYDNIPFIVDILENGELSLLLGAGASNLLELPNWNELVRKSKNEFNRRCLKDNKPGKRIKERITKYSDFDKLKTVTQTIRDSLDEDKYLDVIESILYDGVDFNFNSAKKELLIALVSLIVRNNNQGIDTILTYNFDSLLEWYLELLGIRTNVITKDNPIVSKSSVKILHIHGYLPHENLRSLGHKRTSIIFSKKEFEDKQHSSWEEFWKSNMNYFLSTKCFVSIGFGPSSVEDDLLPVLRQIEKFRKKSGIKEQSAYGFSIFPKEDIPRIKDLQKFQDSLFNDKVVPLFIERDSIPLFILDISKKASFKV